MAPAIFRTLLLSTLLALAVPSLAAASDGAPDRPVATREASDPGVAAEPPAADGRADTSTDQMLSTLGALALGVLGLLWVRRHTARL